MISIVDHLQYLISRHDCVTLPGWGAFIARYESAMLVDGVFKAPTRSLGFNGEILHDDGLLASSLARREGMSYESARAYVESEIESMSNRLKIIGEVVLPRIGRFVREDSQTSFYPVDDDTSIASIAYLGLPDVEMTPIVAEESPGPEEESMILPVRVGPSVWTRVARIAASIVVLVALSFALSTPIIVDSAHDFASMAIPSIKSPEIEPIEEDATEIAADVDHVMYISKPADADAIAVVDLTADHHSADTKVVDASQTSDSYFVIVASYATRSAAERHIATAHGWRMDILKADGRHRVFVGSAADEATAQAILEANIDEFPQAWVYEKK